MIISDIFLKRINKNDTKLTKEKIIELNIIKSKIINDLIKENNEIYNEKYNILKKYEDLKKQYKKLNKAHEKLKKSYFQHINNL